MVYIFKQLLRRILSFILMANIEKYREQYYLPKEDEKQAKFIERPLCGGYIANATSIVIYILYGLFIFGTVMILVGFIVIPIKTVDDRNGMLALIVLDGLLVLWIGFMKLLHLYFENKVTLYFDEYIVDRKYGHKDQIVSYDELGVWIRKRKIKIARGALELPYKNGKIRINIHEEYSNYFLFQFLNRKCGIELPELAEKERKLIRKTGILLTYFGVAFSTFAIDLTFQIMGAVIEMSTKSFWEVYFPGTLKEFCGGHFFLMLGAPLLVFGIIAELLNFIPLRVHFAKYKIFRF